MLQNPGGALPILANFLAPSQSYRAGGTYESSGTFEDPYGGAFRQALDAALHGPAPSGSASADTRPTGHERYSEDVAGEGPRSLSQESSAADSKAVEMEASQQQEAKQRESAEVSVKSTATEGKTATAAQNSNDDGQSDATEAGSISTERLKIDARLEEGEIDGFIEAALAGSAEGFGREFIISVDDGEPTAEPAAGTAEGAAESAAEDGNEDAATAEQTVTNRDRTVFENGDAAGRSKVTASDEREGAEPADRAFAARAASRNIAGERPFDGSGKREQDESQKTARGERRAGVVIEVRDLRPESDKKTADSSEGRSARVDNDASGFSRRLHGDGDRAEATAQREQSSLSRALREQATPEIVRQARLVVRGEASGDIRLVLRPEHLGRVRIELHMEDNRIAGRVIVENASVKEAFQENLQALQRSLHESGIETAGLEVSVGQGGEGKSQGEYDRPARRSAAAEFDELVPRLGEWYDGNGLVNVYV